MTDSCPQCAKAWEWVKAAEESRARLKEQRDALIDYVGLAEAIRILDPARARRHKRAGEARHG